MNRLDILKQIDAVSVSCHKCTMKSSHGSNSFCVKECSVGAEIKTLGDQLIRTGVKSSRILAKGDMMTKSDVAYLIKSGISRVEIRKAMGLNEKVYHQMMEAWGLLEKRDSKNRKVTAS